MRTKRPGHRWRLTDERGLTLIELMIVVGLVALIAAIALIVLYQDVARKSRVSADHGTAAALRSAVAIYYGKFLGVFPPDKVTVEGLVTPTPPTFQCPGQSFTYNPTDGVVLLTVTLPSNC